MARATDTGRAHGSGYVHELALYGSDRELLDTVVPFLLDGVEAGEPTLAALTPRNEELVRQAVGPTSGVSFVPAASEYDRPAATIRSYRARFDALVAAGAEQIRVVGDVPVPAGPRWDEWARYEAAANTVFAGYPLWGLCSYDARTLPDDVLDDLLATHPNVAHGHDHRPNPGFVDPTRFHEQRPAASLDPLQADAPAAALVDPDPAEARAAAAAVAVDAGLDVHHTEDLLVVASELVTNGHLHGSPPVTFEAWAAPGRVLVSVTDGGPGPDHALVGLQRSDRAFGGMGLWIAHQLADDVVLDFGPGGFTVRAGITQR
jgi:anti-sigma regulatory factor (Ser/Thr protein kinase)